MKKTLFYTLAAIFIATMFASCLGSSKVTQRETNDFSYIREVGEAGMIVAYTAKLNMISSPEIRKLTPGTVCYISYEMSSNNVSAEGIFEAYNVAIDQEVKTGKFLYGTTVPQEMKENPVGMENLSVGNAYAGDWIGDYWGIGYKTEKGSNELVNVSVFYDPDNQVDAPEPGETVGVEIPKNENKIVLDVYLEKVKIDDEEVKNPKPTSGGVHVPLASLRTNFLSQINTSDSMIKDANDNTLLRIKFRYWYFEDVKGGEKKLEQIYKGSWGTKGGEFPQYSMAFKADDQ